MTGRERITNICKRLPVDRIAWTTLITNETRSGMSAELREMEVIDFYRYIGCDILQFGNASLPKNLQVPLPRHVKQPETVKKETKNLPDGSVLLKEKTPWGTLTSVSRKGRLIKFPVETVEDLRIMKNIWKNAMYMEPDGFEKAYVAVEEKIGDSGIYVPVTGISPVQQLLQIDMGIVNFYYLLQDYPQEMEELIDILHNCRKREYEFFASRTPGPAVIALENTSSTLTSPAIYRKYSLGHMQDFVNIMHRYGKKAVIHMCGLLKNLLPSIKETGLDGINGLTPPPIGDTPFELALDTLGEDLIILGGSPDCNLFHNQSLSAGEIKQALTRSIPPRIRSAHFLFWLVADGLETELDNFFIVREWIEEHGYF